MADFDAAIERGKAAAELLSQESLARLLKLPRSERSAAAAVCPDLLPHHLERLVEISAEEARKSGPAYIKVMGKEYALDNVKHWLAQPMPIDEAKQANERRIYAEIADECKAALRFCVSTELTTIHDATEKRLALLTADFDARSASALASLLPISAEQRDPSIVAQLNAKDAKIFDAAVAKKLAANKVSAAKTLSNGMPASIAAGIAQLKSRRKQVLQKSYDDSVAAIRRRAQDVSDALRPFVAEPRRAAKSLIDAFQDYQDYDFHGALITGAHGQLKPFSRYIYRNKYKALIILLDEMCTLVRFATDTYAELKEVM